MKVPFATKMDKRKIFPIMGATYSETDFGQIDLDRKTTIDHDIDGTQKLAGYLEKVRIEKKAIWLTGGYLERRSLYQSPLFLQTDQPVRDIHLGVDIWGKPGSPIYCPLDGRIHSFAYNDNPLDYGYTLIVLHKMDGLKFHTLYGHLSACLWDTWQTGKKVNAGSQIARIGEIHENGGWLPHLHFQVIIDMEGKIGDYPGVCSIEDVDYYRMNCPDAGLLIKKAPSS